MNQAYRRAVCVVPVAHQPPLQPPSLTYNQPSSPLSPSSSSLLPPSRDARKCASLSIPFRFPLNPPLYFNPCTLLFRLCLPSVPFLRPLFRPFDSIILASPRPCSPNPLSLFASIFPSLATLFASLLCPLPLSPTLFPPSLDTLTFRQVLA